jgi:hypothetical protein
MFSVNEIRENLAGAWRVMNGDFNGLAQLDTTIEGFWRSFGAIVLLIPVFTLLVLANRQIAADLNLTGGILPVPAEALMRLIEWLLFPGLLALIARPIGLAGQYVPFIVARNWSSIIVTSFLVIPLLAYLGGSISVQVLKPFFNIMLIVSGYFAYRVARTTMAVPPALAVAIVMADFGVSFMIIRLAGAFAT